MYYIRKVFLISRIFDAKSLSIEQKLQNKQKGAVMLKLTLLAVPYQNHEIFTEFGLAYLIKPIFNRAETIHTTQNTLLSCMP